MDIVLLVQPDCPHIEVARARLGEAASSFTGVNISEIVQTPDVLAFRGGSPTFLIDGHDPFPSLSSTGGLCRLYSTPIGLQGAPSIEQLRAVIGGADFDDAS